MKKNFKEYAVLFAVVFLAVIIAFLVFFVLIEKPLDNFTGERDSDDRRDIEQRKPSYRQLDYQLTSTVHLVGKQLYKKGKTVFVAGKKIVKPIPVPKDAYNVILEKDQRRLFDKHGKTIYFFDKRWENEGRVVLENLVKYGCIKENSHVVDFGGGTGYYSLVFSQVTGPKGRVFLVDMNPVVLNDALQVIRYNNSIITAKGGNPVYSNITPVLSTTDDFFIPDESIDMVFACNVHCFHQYPENGKHGKPNREKSKKEKGRILARIRLDNKKTILNIHRCLKKGGYFVIIENTDGVGPPLRLDKEGIVELFESEGFKKVIDLSDKKWEREFLIFEK